MTLILSTPPADHVPRPQLEYIDVHGLMANVMKEIIPHEDNVQPNNILLNSAHGLGKTLMAATIAVQLGKLLDMEIPLVPHDCSQDTEEYQLIGYQVDLGERGTGFRLGTFPQVIKHANEAGVAILLAEEISSLPSGAQKAFNRMTDWRKGIYVPEIGEMFRLEPTSHLIIIATMNPSSYSGVYTLNEDLESRFFPVKVPRPSRTELGKILKKVCPWARPAAIKLVTQLIDESKADATQKTLSTREAVILLQSLHRHDYKPEFSVLSVVNRFDGRELGIVADRVDAIFSTNAGSKAGSGAKHL